MADNDSLDFDFDETPDTEILDSGSWSVDFDNIWDESDDKKDEDLADALDADATNDSKEKDSEDNSDKKDDATDDKTTDDKVDADKDKQTDDDSSDKEDEKSSEDKDLDEIEKLLDSMDDDSDESEKKSDKAVKDLEKDLWKDNANVQILKDDNSRLRENQEKMQQTIRKLMSDTADMSLKNAELEAFGWNFTDPSLLIAVKHYEKAMNWDEASKSKVSQVLKDMYETVTGKDMDKEKIDSDLDKISAVESYNNSSNAKYKDKSWEDDFELEL